MKATKPAKESTPRLEIGNLRQFPRPKFADSLVFPDDVTKLGNSNVSDLMGKYAALQAFVEQECCTWSIELLRTEEMLERAKDEYIRQNKGCLSFDRWRLDIKIRESDVVRALVRRRSNILAFKERAASMVRIYAQLINVLSRELSRRLSTSDGFRHTVSDLRRGM